MWPRIIILGCALTQVFINEELGGKKYLALIPTETQRTKIEKEQNKAEYEITVSCSTTLATSAFL